MTVPFPLRGCIAPKLNERVTFTVNLVLCAGLSKQYDNYTSNKTKHQISNSNIHLNLFITRFIITRFCTWGVPEIRGKVS